MGHGPAPDQFRHQGAGRPHLAPVRRTGAGTRSRCRVRKAASLSTTAVTPDLGRRWDRHHALHPHGGSGRRAQRGALQLPAHPPVTLFHTTRDEDARALALLAADARMSQSSCMCWWMPATATRAANTSVLPCPTGARPASGSAAPPALARRCGVTSSRGLAPGVLSPGAARHALSLARGQSHVSFSAVSPRSRPRSCAGEARAHRLQTTGRSAESAARPAAPATPAPGPRRRRHRH